MKRHALAIPEFEAPSRTVRRGRASADRGVATDLETHAPMIVATADPSLARMLAFALDQARLTYSSFTSGSALLRALLTMPVGSQPPVVILDADLPGVDGYAILERLAVARPDTFLLVVLSSHADESVQVRSLLAGALDHLAKPFNIRVLVAKVQRWVAITARWHRAA